MSDQEGPLYLGFDLSTQQLKGGAQLRLAFAAQLTEV
jgi:hypothetical protein